MDNWDKFEKERESGKPEDFILPEKMRFGIEPNFGPNKEQKYIIAVKDGELCYLTQALIFGSNLRGESKHSGIAEKYNIRTSSSVLGGGEIELIEDPEAWACNESLEKYDRSFREGRLLGMREAGLVGIGPILNIHSNSGSYGSVSKQFIEFYKDQILNAYQSLDSRIKGIFNDSYEEHIKRAEIWEWLLHSKICRHKDIELFEAKVGSGRKN